MLDMHLHVLYRYTVLQYVINTEERFAPDNSNAYMSQNKLSFETSPLNTC